MNDFAECFFDIDIERGEVKKNVFFITNNSKKSDPEGIRTPNRQSRNLIFYPVELLGQLFIILKL